MMKKGDIVGPAEKWKGKDPERGTISFRKWCKDDCRGVIHEIKDGKELCQIKMGPPHYSLDQVVAIRKDSIRLISSPENPEEHSVECKCKLFWFDHNDDCPFKDYYKKKRTKIFLK